MGSWSDSKGNTWNNLTVYTGGNFSVRLSYAIPSSTSQIGTSHTFTLGASGAGSFNSVGIMAFVGTQAATALRAATDVGNATGSNLSITPTAVNDVLATCLSDDNVSVKTISGGSFTVVDSTSATGNGETGATAWEAAPNTSAISWTWLPTGEQDGAAFEVGAAPGGGPTPTGLKSKKLLKLDASTMPSFCAGMTMEAPDCTGFSSGTEVSFACLYADGSCGAATVPVNLLRAVFGSNSQALAPAGAVTMGQHTCLVGANLGAAAVTMGTLGSIDPASFTYSCTP